MNWFDEKVLPGLVIVSIATIAAGVWAFATASGKEVVTRWAQGWLPEGTVLLSARLNGCPEWGWVSAGHTLLISDPKMQGLSDEHFYKGEFNQPDEVHQVYRGWPQYSFTLCVRKTAQ